MQGDPGKSGQKVRKHIFLHIKGVEERKQIIICRYAVVSSSWGRACANTFAREKGTRLVDMFPTNFANSGCHQNLQLISCSAFCGLLTTVKFHSLLGEQVACVFSLFLTASSDFS